MTVKLKTCPFCGAQPGGTKTEYKDERSGYNFVIYIVCQCGAMIGKPSHRGAGGWCDDNGHAERSVIAAWNTRVMDDANNA
jgi:hypothetical protein